MIPRRQTESVPEVDQCGACGAEEGELHDLYCDMERCPFCGGQLMSCGCASRHFYPTYDFRMDSNFNFIVPFAGLPPEVYANGLPDHQELEWQRMLEAKGRIPFIRYPIVCARCGVLWPELFSVPDSEWEYYIEPRVRRKVICWPCYQTIKQLIDNATQRRKEES